MVCCHLLLHSHHLSLHSCQCLDESPADFWPGPVPPPNSAGVGVPLLRGAGTDINLPLALAIIGGIFVELHAFRTQGMVYLREFFPFPSFYQGGWRWAWASCTWQRCTT